MEVAAPGESRFHFFMTDRAERFVSFPPGVLGKGSARMDVIYFGQGLLALNKPAGVAVEPHPLWPVAPDVRSALRACDAQRPSLKPYGLDAPGGIAHIDPELSGVALLGVNAAAVAHWRNVFGSRQLGFHFRFLAQDTEGGDDTFACDLPLAVHDEKSLVLVTHTQGKAAVTRFARGEKAGAFYWWNAFTDFLRPHQIRVHAAECGLRIVGETVYGQGAPEPLLSALKGRFKNRAEEKPLYGALCLHLADVTLPDGTVITAPLPQKMAVLADKLLAFAS